VLVDKLLVIGNDRLGDSLTDSVDLGGVSTTSDSDTDIDVGELLKSSYQKRFVDLESQDLGLDEAKGLSIDLDESFTSLFPNMLAFCPPVLISIVFDRFSYLAVGDGGGYSQSVSISHISRKSNSSLPVFFLPKHCTLWVVEAILCDCREKAVQCREYQSNSLDNSVGANPKSSRPTFA